MTTNTFKKGELLSKAIHIAVNAHHGQFDRGGNAYVLHVLEVMRLVSNETKDEELISIAVLHDSVEDCKNITWSFLREQGMTERVIEGIRCLTKIQGESYEEYKEKVFSNKDAMIVKRADLTHNSDIRRLKGIREKDIERTVKYHKFFMEIEQKLSKE